MVFLAACALRSVSSFENILGRQLRISQGHARSTATNADGDRCNLTFGPSPKFQRGGDSYGGRGKTFEPMFGRARSSVVVLHGLSGTTMTVVPLVVFAQLFRFSGTRFILPQASVAYVDYRGQKEPSWFNMGGLYRGGTEYPQEILASVCRIERIIKGEKARGIEKIALVGLSQGGAVATSFFAISDIKISAVVGIAAWFPDSMAQYTKQNDTSTTTPLLMVHGDKDVVITKFWSDSTVNVLRRLGRKVTQERVRGVGHTFGLKLLAAAKIAINFLKFHGI